MIGLLAGPLLVGCASQTDFVTVRDASRNPFVSSLASLPSVRDSATSERTTQLLRRYNLEASQKTDTDFVATKLAHYATPETRTEHEFAIAEVEYLAAKRVEKSQPAKAIGHYGTALLHAYRYLFDKQSGVACNPYDPQFRGACDLYNQSLEGLLRLVQRDGPIRPGQRRSIQTAEHLCSFDVDLKSTGWHAEDIAELKLVSDYQVTGLRNHYKTFGLGVPLIAVRGAGHSGHGGHGGHASEAYYPPGLTFALTAVLRVIDNPMTPTGAEQRAAGPRFVLELRDPLDESRFEVAGQTPPLESDLSTPLAFFLDKPQLKGQTLSTLGLLKPDSVSELQGLYMLEPYDPKKMPVLMVHGLWSSPVTWMEMYNDLRSDPQIHRHYQFWFYLYPTGQPFWISAAQLRRELAQVRVDVDPGRAAGALDQMVLVGHSMGGLVSKLQSVDSGDDFWRINSDQAFAELRVDPELRGPLARAYFFRPNPSVRRVITIGTPHRGSAFANPATRWAARTLIASPSALAKGRHTLLRENPGYFRNDSTLSIATSIDSLAPDSPLLPVLLNAKPGPWVEYHNIVGRVSEDGAKGYFAEDGDGVVSLASASLDGAPGLASQDVVQADHVSVHRHPQSIYTVRQVLLKQIQELENLPFGGAAPSAPGPIELVRRLPPAESSTAGHGVLR